MDMFDFAGLLFGGNRNRTEATTVTATGAAASDGGVAGVTLDADVTPAEDVGEDADQTIIDLPTSPDVDEGDELIVTLVGDGPLKTPIVTANPGAGDRMRALANSAKTVADAAQAVAEAVGQHFWSADDGIHVTEATQEDWNTNHSGANVLINSIGQLFRDGLNNLLTLTTEDGARALTIWDGLGNAASNVRAVIGETIQLGKSSDKHLTIDSDSVDLMNGSDVIGTFGSSGVTIGSEHSQDYHNVVDSNGLSIWTKRAADLTKLLVMRFNRDGITFSEDRKHTISLYNVLHEIVADSSGLHLYAYGDPVIDSPVARIDLQAAAGSTTGNGSIKFTTRVGSNTWSTPAGTVLWSGAYHMTASHTATLTHSVSTCPTGIVLHWQAYVSGSAANQDQLYCFVPKTHVANFAGGGVQMPLMTSGFGNVGCKYVYVYDDRVTGAANNNQSGTGSSITYNNAYWVLTQIIAV